jgi:hypothetical protein
MGFYSIKIHINSNNQGLLNSVKNIIPSSDDPIIEPGEYNVQEGILKPFDFNFFMVDMQFKEKINRDIALQNIKGLTGIINSCLSGSKIVGYIQNHNDSLSCDQETILEKE